VRGWGGGGGGWGWGGEGIDDFLINFHPNI